MTSLLTAVYEGGLLRPSAPLDLPEGTSVEIVVRSIGKSPAADPKRAAEIVAAIAALPTAGGDPMTGRDHDRVLYGPQGAR